MSDFSPVAKKHGVGGNLDFYVDMAKAFLNDKDCLLYTSEYFAAVYREAVELTAYLCEMYGLDPLEDGVVICHAEGARSVSYTHLDVYKRQVPGKWCTSPGPAP